MLPTQVDPGSVIAIVFIMLFLYVVFTLGPLLLVAWGPAQRVLRASDADAVAVAMCVGTKTVALGIPIIQAVYEHNPAAGLLSLPLIIYHAEQILLGSLLTAPLKRWVARRTKARELEQESASGNGNGAGGADPESGTSESGAMLKSVGDVQPRRRRSEDGPAEAVPPAAVVIS